MGKIKGVIHLLRFCKGFVVVVRRGCCKIGEYKLMIYDHGAQLRWYMYNSRSLGDFCESEMKDKIFILDLNKWVLC